MCDIYNTYAFIYITSIQLRNICITKKCVLITLKNIAHYYYNGFEEYI